MGGKKIMIKCVNGEYIEMTPEEIEKDKEDSEQAIYQERIKPRTTDEAIIALAKSIVTAKVAESDDKTLGIQCMALFEQWKKGDYKVGDVRTKPETGYPYECITQHNSIDNPEWTIDNRTLWKPWHSKSAEFALPYEEPTGAHDMYKQGEYMIFKDKNIYECLEDTNFDPETYPQAWKKSN